MVITSWSALLRSFGLTAEGFRRKFCEAKRDKDETAAQFVVRLVGYLDRWIQLTGIESTYEGLKSMLVRERFVDSCDDRLALYLRERSPTDLDEVVSLADHYLNARFNKGIHNREANGDKRTFYDRNSRPYRNDSRVSKGVHSELKTSCQITGKQAPIRRREGLLSTHADRHAVDISFTVCFLSVCPQDFL